jgi:hypothetical protein
LSRAIKRGALSANRTETGSYLIDPAELERVYPLAALGEAAGATGAATRSGRAPAAAPRHPGCDQRRPAAEMAGLAPQGRLKKGRWGVALRGPPGLRLGRTRRNCPPSVTGRHRMRVGSNAKPPSIPSIRRRQVRRACARARCRPRHDFSRLGARSSGSRSPRPRGCARPVAVRASRAWLRNARVCASAITTSGSTKLLKGGDRPHEAETARS